MKKIFLLLSLIAAPAFADHTQAQSIICKVPKKTEVKQKKKYRPVHQEVKKVEAGKDVQINVSQWMSEGEEESCSHEENHEMVDSQTLIRLFKQSEKEKAQLAKKLADLEVESAELRAKVKSLKGENSEIKSNLRMVNRNYYMLEQTKVERRKSSDGQIFIGPVIGYGPIKIKDDSPESDEFEQVRMEYGAMWGGRLSGTSGDFNLGLSGLSNRSVMFDINYKITK